MELSVLEEKLKYKFKNIENLKNALIHPSYNSGSKFQEFEFLGDRVLGFFISSYLVKLNKYNIKDLANTYNYLINADAMYQVAFKLNLQKYLQHKIEKLSKKNISDVVESVFGAIFLDSNYEEVSKIIIIHWKELINSIDKVDLVNPKMKLQEYSQAIGCGLPEYVVTEIKMINKKPTYSMKVSLKSDLFAIAQGASKNIASNNCAKELLKKIAMQENE